MNLLEKDLENLLFEMLKDPQRLFTDRHFVAFDDYVYTRQMNLGVYGIADIVGCKIEVDSEAKEAVFSVHVIEMKRDKIDVSTFSQACKYMAALKQAFYSKYQDFDLTFNCSISLVGTSVDTSNNLLFLPNYCNNLFLYTMAINPYTGVSFCQIQNGLVENDNESFFDAIPVINEVIRYE